MRLVKKRHVFNFNENDGLNLILENEALKPFITFHLDFIQRKTGAYSTALQNHLTQMIL